MMSVEHSPSHGVRVARGVLLMAAVVVALCNGSLWSPFFDSVAYILHLATRGYPFVTPQRLFYVTPVAIATMTLLIAGIPAAIYERIRGHRTSTSVSIGIWLVATMLLTLPTILKAIGDD